MNACTLRRLPANGSVAKWVAMFVLATLVLATAGRTVQACPFCSAVTQTFAEEMKTMDAVLVAELVKAPKIPTTPVGSLDPLEKADFKVVEVLKGNEWVSAGGPLQTLYYGDAQPGTKFLIMGSQPPELAWNSPLQLSDRGLEYLKKLAALPAGPERLEFFQQHLEDADEMLARDAYDEFAKTPYAGVIALKEKMDREQLVAWIKDPKVPATRRRLYLTMLGICGTSADAPMLEAMLRSDDRDEKRGLDAMIACYLSLCGSAGMPLIEELFLKNHQAEYADTYSAIMAIRFHGTETTVIPRPRLIEGLHAMLERPDLADLVIPDLSRLEDWDAMPRLVQLFKDAKEETSWVRVPVINFLQACPLPQAKAAIEELAKIDPDAVKRASTYFAFGRGTAPAIDARSTAEKSAAAATPNVDTDPSTGNVPKIPALPAKTP